MFYIVMLNVRSVTFLIKKWMNEWVVIYYVHRMWLCVSVWLVHLFAEVAFNSCCRLLLGNVCRRLSRQALGLEKTQELQEHHIGGQIWSVLYTYSAFNLLFTLSVVTLLNYSANKVRHLMNFNYKWLKWYSAVAYCFTVNITSQQGPK